jgi:hypothetical protein
VKESSTADPARAERRYPFAGMAAFINLIRNLRRYTMKTDPTQPVTTLEIKGQSFALVFNFDAFVKAEDVTGYTLLFLNRASIDTPKLGLICAMLFACTRVFHPDLTYEAAMALVTVCNFAKVWRACAEAWVLGINAPVVEEVAVGVTLGKLN